MTLLGTLRILASKWYLVIAGTLLSLMLAGVVYTQVPAQYTSTGVAVLVQPKRAVYGPSANPLLNFDASLSTTALMLVQSIDSPQTAAQLGILPRAESFTIEQASTDASLASGFVVQPFISVKTKALTAERSAQLVDALFELARQNLSAQQKQLRVLPQNYIRLQTLGYASTPKRIIGTVVAVTGSALLIGLCFTFLSVILVARQERRSLQKVSSSLDRGSDTAVGVGSEDFLMGPDGAGIGLSNGTRGLATRGRG